MDNKTTNQTTEFRAVSPIGTVSNNCVFCGNQLRDLKKDWRERKYHKICFKKQKEKWYVQNLIKNYKKSNICNLAAPSSS